MGRRPSWISISCCVLLMLIVAPGCASHSRSRPAPVSGGDFIASPSPRDRGDSNLAPEWATQPHSWGKLDAIERWLHEAPTTGFWFTEGQLQLAEGQLRFAHAGQRGAGSAANKAANDIVAFRRDASIEGFEAVRASSGATGDQKSRAASGLREARGILRGVERTTEAGSALASPSVPIGGLVPRSAWSASRADQGNMRPSTKTWKWITVHHSVFAPSTSKLEDSLDVVRRIQRQHVDVENYADIGYHFLIDRAGRVIEGRRLKWQGAHAGDSQKNRGNVGICLLGNFETEHPTKTALASLDKLVLELQTKLRIPRRNVRPHKAWKETACPGRHLMPWFTRF